MNNIYSKIRPYTYLIKCIPTNQVYYGVRFRNKVPAHEDLWTFYFTSSKKVSKLRQQYGNDAFLFEVRKEFDDVEAAFQWEKRVLTRMKVLQSTIWLNASIAATKFRREGPVSEKTRQKMSIAKRNRVVTSETKAKLSQNKKNQIPWNKGKTGVVVHSAETKAKIGAASATRPWTPERCAKISAAKKGKPSPLKGRAGSPKTESTKDKLRSARTGRTWYNNGQRNKISFDHPGDGWVVGKLPYTKPFKTLNGKKITIYNASGEPMFRCDGDFERVCKANNLPFQILQRSYLRNGAPIFATSASLKNSSLPHKHSLVGWYALYDIE